jgi:tetratricopeptide (TPR) repeat protein
MKMHNPRHDHSIVRGTIFTLVLFSCAAAAQAPDPSLAPGLHLLQEGRTTLDQKTLVEARDYFSHLISKDRNNSEYFYQLARVDAYRIDAYSAQHDKKNAEATLAQAISEVEHAIELNDRSAKSHSLLADLYGRKISMGGFMVGPRYGPKSDAENKKAFALDPKDPTVLASLGREYLMSPPTFGGDVNKAIVNFRQATEADPANDENFVWLSLAYKKAGNNPDADKALQEALHLNPDSVFAKNTAAGKQ